MTAVPTPEQARRARDRVLAQAANNGRRPSVLAVARELGLSNTTFRRHFRDIAEKISDARRTPTPGLRPLAAPAHTTSLSPATPNSATTTANSANTSPSPPSIA